MAEDIAIVVVNGNRYFIQNYTKDGKKGKSLRGRIDTPNGQRKASEGIVNGSDVLISRSVLFDYLDEEREDLHAYVYPDEILEHLEEMSDKDLAERIHGEFTGKGESAFGRKLSSVGEKIETLLSSSKLFKKALDALFERDEITKSDVEEGEKLAKSGL